MDGVAALPLGCSDIGNKRKITCSCHAANDGFIYYSYDIKKRMETVSKAKPYPENVAHGLLLPAAAACCLLLLLLRTRLKVEVEDEVRLRLRLKMR